jgi:hypothetical protein
MMAQRTTRFATASEGNVDEYALQVGYSERSLGSFIFTLTPAIPAFRVH